MLHYWTTYASLSNGGGKNLKWVQMHMQRYKNMHAHSCKLHNEH